MRKLVKEFFYIMGQTRKDGKVMVVTKRIPINKEDALNILRNGEYYEEDKYISFEVHSTIRVEKISKG